MNVYKFNTSMLTAAESRQVWEEVAVEHAAPSSHCRPALRCQLPHNAGSQAHQHQTYENNFGHNSSKMLQLVQAKTTISLQKKVCPFCEIVNKVLEVSWQLNLGRHKNVYETLRRLSAVLKPFAACT